DELRNELPIPYLLIEDFGTTGLTGSVALHTDPAPGIESDTNHFYWFVRNVGRSGKKQLEGGSWGVGKYVFPDASRINTFFFVTRRERESDSLFMGQSVLRQHDGNNGERLYPYGHFADHEEEDLFALPITDEFEIRRFSKAFGVSRTQEHGLSIVVPFNEPDLDRESLVRAAIMYFFNPILSGGLEIEVATSGDSDSPVSIDLDSISQLVESEEFNEHSGQFTADQIKRVFYLAQNNATSSDEHRIVLDPLEPNADPTRQRFEDRFRGDDLERARIAYEERKLLLFSIRVWVHPKDEEPVLSFFDLSIEKDRELKRAQIQYVRNDLTIPNAGNPNRRTPNDFRALLIVNDDHLSALLRDSEEPSHSRWNLRQNKVRDKYDFGPSTVRFVNNAIPDLLRCLARPASEVDRDALKDFFFVPRSGRQKSQRVGPIPTGDPQPVAITKRYGGFTFVMSDPELEYPIQIRLRVAYDTNRGDAFARYDHRDFLLEDPNFSLTLDGCTLQQKSGNSITVLAIDADARFAITGFDLNRDLVVEGEALV
ncbi:MAG: hypothetical protein OXI59_08170, partial [Gemmatimonadota bacterium]|nr:hypothetical protein [Gemmatimonadota bacterium]